MPIPDIRECAPTLSLPLSRGAVRGVCQREFPVPERWHTPRTAPRRRTAVVQCLVSRDAGTRKPRRGTTRRESLRRLSPLVYSEPSPAPLIPTSATPAVPQALLKVIE
jgi:hypothetical protein